MERLSAYMDGELAEAERATVAAHLRRCGECARHLEDLAALDAVARELPAEAPPGYFDRLPGRIRFKVAQPRPARRLPAWSWAAAAALLLAVIAPRVLDRQAARVDVPPPAAPSAAPPVAQASQPEASRPDALAGAPPPAARPAPQGPAPTAPPDARQAHRGGLASREKYQEEAKRSSGSVGVERRRAAEPDSFAAAPPAAEPPATAPLAKAAGRAATAPAAAAPLAENQAVVAPSRPAAAEDDELQGPATQQLRDEPEKDLAESLGLADPADKADKKEAAGPPAPGGIALHRAEGARSQERRARLSFAALLAERPTTLEAARGLRDKWRAFLEQSPPARQADEARVQLVETGLRACELSNDPLDRSLARRDGEAYLRRPDAAQGARVRALLARIGS
jgi:hypothetical protein